MKCVMKFFSYIMKIIIFSSILFLFSGCAFFKEKQATTIFSETKENNIEKVKKLENNDISLLFLGDLMFDRSIRQFAEKKGNDFIFGKISDVLRENNLVVTNLEGPITDNISKSVGTKPEEKGHFIFTFDKSLTGTLFKQNIKLVNLGNNHILNFGIDGLEQTKKYLAESGIEYFGDPKADQNYLIKEIDGIKVGFVGYSQFEENSIEKAKKNIAIIKNIADVVIVYTHWGKEYEKTPSNSIKDIAHVFIDAGADLIIGSHPHVIQNEESYKGKRIYYSLGNFVFDQYFSPETQKGLAVKVRINRNKELIFEDIVLFMGKNGQTEPFVEKIPKSE
jgi:gamma-polyglutamate biosynthesis protein CapA